MGSSGGACTRPGTRCTTCSPRVGSTSVRRSPTSCRWRSSTRRSRCSVPDRQARWCSCRGGRKADMFDSMKPQIQAELAKIKEAGLWKDERVLASAQGPEVMLADGREVIVLCANNYLGLSSDPRVIAAAHAAIDARGFGLSSVRFICGTQDIHKTLERKIADFLRTEDTLLYAACFDANGGVFEPLLGEEDAIISDALNHASIIDGVRLCKAHRWRYEHADMADLERCLLEAVAKGARRLLIATDGVFS